jgi:FkbM family methyltransferase
MNGMSGEQTETVHQVRGIWCRQIEPSARSQNPLHLLQGASRILAQVLQHFRHEDGVKCLIFERIRHLFEIPSDVLDAGFLNQPSEVALFAGSPSVLGGPEVDGRCQVAKPGDRGDLISRRRTEFHDLRGRWKVGLQELSDECVARLRRHTEVAGTEHKRSLTRATGGSGGASQCEEFAGPLQRRGGGYDEWILRRARHQIVRQLHGRGFYRVGPEPFGAVDKPLLLRRYGINLVFDVGANVGEYANHLRYLGYVGRITSFEPSSEAFAVLESRARDDPLWDAHQVAVGDQDGEATFNIANESVCSSFLPMNERLKAEVPGVAVTSRETVRVCRLDTFVDEVDEVDEVEADDHVWVKFDVEGHELAAIAGAQKLLARAEVVEVELAIEQHYEGEPLFFEVAPAVYDLNFRLIAVAPAFKSPSGRTLRFDGVFARR